MYRQKFTLSDLFMNDKLKDVLPQVKVKEIQNEDGDVGYRNKGISNITTFLRQYAIMGARNSMKSIHSNTADDTITISGKLKSNYTIYNTYDDVLRTLQMNAYMMTMMGNNGKVIAKALQQTKINAKYLGYEPKLYLKINNLEEIKLMDRMQKASFMKDIVENIYFSDDFKKVREPRMEKGNFIYNARNELRDYASLKRAFDRKVGVKSE